MKEIAVEKFEDYHNVNHLVASQWETLVLDKEVPKNTRKIIGSSWRRCLEKNLNPLRKAADQIVTDSRLEELRYENKFLLDVSAPYMDELFKYFDGHLALVMLSNAEGIILEGRASSKTWSHVEQINFVPGADWSEMGAGTNAIGTAIVENKPAQIFANEHFCQGWHHLICSAAPIHDPFTNEILGTIDLTGEKNLVYAHDLYLVINQAKKIEKEIQNRLMEQNKFLFEHIVDYIQHPFVVFDQKGIIRRYNKYAAPYFKKGSSLTSMIDPGILQMFNSKKNIYKTICHNSGKKWKVSLYPYYMNGSYRGGFAVFEEEKKLHFVSKSGKTRYTFRSLITKSPQMFNLINKAKKAAMMDADILITGESGVGKEVLVQSIHSMSSRADGPFVAVNCGALPKELIASELFGHTPGAFTGAHPRGKKGKFLSAHEGTIFLDEIGELPLDIQAYLLRVLEEREVIPLGGTEAIPINVRVIAATNRDLEKEVEEGRFREDLYYRIHVLHLRIPPLRQRKEDIPLLVNHFLEQKMNSDYISVTPQALELLTKYDWPGNIRQLKHVIDQAILNDDDQQICVNDLPYLLKQGEHRNLQQIKMPPLDKESIEKALKQTEYNIAQTARLLRTSRTTIYKKMKEYNLR